MSTDKLDRSTSDEPEVLEPKAVLVARAAERIAVIGRGDTEAAVQLVLDDDSI